jgi:hypothetical protein
MWGEEMRRPDKPDLHQDLIGRAVEDRSSSSLIDPIRRTQLERPV